MPNKESEPATASARESTTAAAEGSDAAVSSSRPALSRGLAIAIGVAAVLVAALGLRAFPDVVGPVFLGLVLSIVVQPVRRVSARHGLPAWLGTVLSLVAVYAMVVGLVVILVLSGAQLAGLLTDYTPQFEAWVQSLGETLNSSLAVIDTC